MLRRLQGLLGHFRPSLSSPVRSSSSSSSSNSNSNSNSSSSRSNFFSTTTAASTRMTSDNSPDPRWKQLVAQGIARAFKEGEKSSVLYQTVSTIEPGPPPVPQTRYVVHRGFVNEQRSSNKDSPSPVEAVQTSFGSNTCLLTTTDIRAPKAQQMIAMKKSYGEARGEICWWMESSQLQFRLTGNYHLLPTSSHPVANDFPGKHLAPLSSSSSSSEEKSKSFSWTEERSRIYKKLSPSLLASFARPVPGSEHPNKDQLKEGEGPGEEGGEVKEERNSPWPLELPQPGKEENEEQKKLLQESEKNFALIVFEPIKVDVVDLSRDTRSVFHRKGDSPNDQWTESRVVP